MVFSVASSSIGAALRVLGNNKSFIHGVLQGCEIVVGTPGRLIDVIKDNATNLQRITYFVIDEADKMFRMGFEPQVRSISGQIRPDRQTVLFSATFPPKVEHLARDILVNPTRVTVGTIGAANADIKQVVDVMRPSDKYRWLADKIHSFLQAGQVLVFVGTKQATEELAAKLKTEMGLKVGFIHGNKTQHQRMETLAEFKAKKTDILVATDVASRGLDIRGLKTVVNYDMARDIDSHVHRVGRTGRAGENGIAYTLFTNQDERMAGLLVRSLEMAKQPVPFQLTQIARSNGTWKAAWSHGVRGGGGGRKQASGKITGGLGSHGAGYSSAQTAAQAAAKGKKISKFVKSALNDEKKKNLFGSLAQMANSQHKDIRQAQKNKRKNARRMGEGDGGDPLANFKEKAYSLARGGGSRGSLRTQTIRAQFASSFCEASKNDLEDQFKGQSSGATIILGKGNPPGKNPSTGFSDGPPGFSNRGGFSDAPKRGFSDGPPGFSNKGGFSDAPKRGFSDGPPASNNRIGGFSDAPPTSTIASANTSSSNPATGERRRKRKKRWDVKSS
eukprot:jgi/Bigna1/85825/estExt_fgenesh1_pg.C_60203